MIAALQTESFEQLTLPEREKLRQLESIVTTGFKAYLDAGRALNEIRESRLYREDGTFEEYLALRWNLKPSRAYQLMDAANVVEGLVESSTIVEILPSNEAQCRELSRVEPEKRPEVWQEALQRTDGKPTAKVIRDVAEQWEDEEPAPVQRHSLPLFQRPDLTEVERTLRDELEYADDVTCPTWEQINALLGQFGEVLSNEEAQKKNVLPFGALKQVVAVVSRPELNGGQDFPIRLFSREHAWRFYQENRDRYLEFGPWMPTTDEHPAGVLASAASCEHYTPEWVWKAALEVFGVDEFDLDPSTYEGSPIPCKRRFTREDDGLSQQWDAGYLWSNFPYSDINPDTGKKMQVMGLWVDKLLEETNAGRTKQAMTLVKSDCRPEWFQRLLNESTAFCMLAKAIKFDTPDGPGGSSFFGSVVFYFGEDVERFYQVFSSLGVCCQSLEPEFMGW